MVPCRELPSRGPLPLLLRLSEGLHRHIHRVRRQRALRAAAAEPRLRVVFVLDAADGTLDLYVQGDKKLKQDLQKLFTRAILHEELGEENRNSIPYELNKLKDRAFAFPTDPAGRHYRGESAADAALRSRQRAQAHHVRGAPKGPLHEIHDLMHHALHEQRLPMSMVSVTSAVIQMRFNGTGRGRDEKTLSFRISFPDSCNLKDKPEHLVAKKHLKLWGLERE